MTFVLALLLWARQSLSVLYKLTASGFYTRIRVLKLYHWIACCLAKSMPIISPIIGISPHAQRRPQGDVCVIKGWLKCSASVCRGSNKTLCLCVVSQLNAITETHPHIWNAQRFVKDIQSFFPFSPHALAFFRAPEGLDTLTRYRNEWSDLFNNPRES